MSPFKPGGMPWRARCRTYVWLVLLLLAPIALFPGGGCSAACQKCLENPHAMEIGARLLTVVVAANPALALVNMFLGPVKDGLKAVFAGFVEEQKDKLPPPLRESVDKVQALRSKVLGTRQKLEDLRSGRGAMDLATGELRGKLAGQEEMLRALRLAHAEELKELDFAQLAQLTLRINEMEELLLERRLELENLEAELGKHDVTLKRLGRERADIGAKRQRIALRLEALREKRTKLEADWEALDTQRREAGQREFHARMKLNAHRDRGGDAAGEKTLEKDASHWGGIKLNLDFKLEALLASIRTGRAREQEFEAEDARLKSRDFDLDLEMKGLRVKLPDLEQRREKARGGLASHEAELGRLKLELEQERLRVKNPKGLKGDALARHKRMLASLEGFEKERGTRMVELGRLRADLDKQRKELELRDARIGKLEAELDASQKDYEMQRLKMMNDLRASEKGRLALQRQHLALLQSINAHPDIRHSPYQFVDGGEWEEDLGHVSGVEFDTGAFSRVDWPEWADNDFALDQWDPSIKPVRVGLQQKALFDAPDLAVEGPALDGIRADIGRRMQSKIQDYDLKLRKKKRRDWELAPCDLPESTPFFCTPPSPWGPPLAPITAP